MAPETSGTAARETERMGRIPRLTDENRASLIENIREGLPITTAGILAGIPKGTLMRWLQAGRSEDGETIYTSLAIEVDEALADFQRSKIREVSAAGAKDHRAAEWLLERRFPREFGDPRAAANVNLNVNLIASPEWQNLSDRILAALDPYPEALAAVMAEIDGGGMVIDGEAREVAELAA